MKTQSKVFKTKVKKIKEKEIDALLSGEVESDEIYELPKPPKKEIEKEEFKTGDIIVDKSSGKRFHFHNQSVVISEPNRFTKAK